MFKEAIAFDRLEEQLHGALSARLLRGRLQVNAAFCSRPNVDAVCRFILDFQPVPWSWFQEKACAAGSIPAYC